LIINFPYEKFARYVFAMIKAVLTTLQMWAELPWKSLHNSLKPLHYSQVLRDKRESFFKVSHSCIKCFLARREGSVRTGRTGAGHIFAVDFIHLQLSSI